MTTTPQIGATETLTEAEEREIVWLSVFDMPTQREVAEQFGVSQATVSRVVSEYSSHTGPDLELSILDEFGE